MPIHDIIGDVHGQYAKLVALLDTLGYRPVDGAYRHPDPERTAIFVGDLIDRGPGQVETVELVRAMVAAGSARMVMGNHEFNALGWATPIDDGSGSWARPQTEAKRSQHEAYLAQVVEGSPLHLEHLDWFRTLPLWIDEPGLPRVVHACWNEPAMTSIRDVLGDQPMSDEFIREASRTGSNLYEAVEVVLKGPEVDLPSGVEFRLENEDRTRARIAWWNLEDPILSKIALIPHGQDAGTLPDTELPHAVDYRYESDQPVYFGHYWMRGAPEPVADGMICVDYSAGKDGSLVACTVDSATPDTWEFTEIPHA